MYFQTGGAIQNVTPVYDKAHKRQIGVICQESNNTALGLIGAGRAESLPVEITCQVNSNQLNFTWEVPVAANDWTGLVTIDVRRPTVAEVTSAIEAMKDRDFLVGLPHAWLTRMVNVAPPLLTLNGYELLRGGLFDTVELRNGDRINGSFAQQNLAITTAFGKFTLPSDKVVAMINTPEVNPRQLLVTSNGELFSGTLTGDGVDLQLTSGQTTHIAMRDIARVGWHVTGTEADTFPDDLAMVQLTSGDRLQIERPKTDIAVRSRFGAIALPAAALAELSLQSPEHGLDEVFLTDGSRFAVLLDQPSLALDLAGAAGQQTINVNVPTLIRLQFSKPADPSPTSGVLKLTNADRLVGSLTGTLSLRTAFDTLSVDAAQIMKITPPKGPATTCWSRSGINRCYAGSSPSQRSPASSRAGRP